MSRPIDPRFAASGAAFAAGRTDEGLELLLQGIGAMGEATPVEAFRRLVLVLVRLSRFSEARTWCDAALRWHGEDFELCNLSGVIHRRLGNHTAAISALDNALRIRPDSEVALFNKLNVYNDMALGEPAVPIGLELVRRSPDSAAVLRAAGAACRNLGDWNRAQELLDAALRLQPAYVEAWLDRIALATISQSPDEGLALTDLALAALPGDRRLLESRAVLLRKAGRDAEAEALLTGMLERADQTAWAQYQLGRLLRLRDPPRAMAYFRRATEIEPANPEYRLALVGMLSSSPDSGEGAALQEGYDLLMELRRERAVPKEWLVIAQGACRAVGDHLGAEALGDFSELGEFLAGGTDHAAFLRQLPRVASPEDRRMLVEHHRAWGRGAQALADRNPIIRPPRVRRAGKLRLGFMSSDLCNHVAGLFTLPLFDFIDEERFEVYAYSFNPQAEDRIQRNFASKATAFRWRPGISDQGAAQMIADDDLDMLIELGAATTTNKLEVMAYRPARLQASWLGYPHSTGLQTIDYIICDRFLLPEDPALLIETPLVMPNAWLVMGPGQFRENPAIDPVSAEQRNGFVTFGTFNQPYKYSLAVLAIWAKVVASTPESRFLFVRPEAGARSFRENMLASFAAEGVGPERILFEPVRGNHLRHYNRIDISLDTFPLTGGTTTCDSLWMGVPVVSLVGEAMFERLSYSLLSNAGLGELAVRTLDDYVATAARLAGESGRRAAVRAGLRDRIRSSPLGQAKAFAKDFYDMVAATVAAAG